MSETGNTHIGSLRADLEANTAQFEASMNRARSNFSSNAASINRGLAAMEKSWSRLSAGIAVLTGGLGAVALTLFMRQSLDAVGGLGELAEQLGVSTDALQVYQYAATQAGMTNEELETGLARLTRTIGEAAEGEKKALDAFNALGVGILDANGKLRSSEAILIDLAARIAAIDDPARRAALAVEFFGKSGQKLLPLLSGGAEGFAALEREARGAGAVLSAGQIADADKTADKLAAVNLQIQKMAQSLAALGAPTLLSAMENIDLALEGFKAPEVKSLARIEYEITGARAAIAALKMDLDGLGKSAGFGGQDASMRRELADWERQLKALEARKAFLTAETPKAEPAPAAVTSNPRSKQDIEAEKAITDSLTKKAMALIAEAEGFDKAAGEAARYKATAEALEQAKAKGFASLTTEQLLKIEMIATTTDEIEALKRAKEQREANTKAVAEQVDQMFMLGAAQAEGANSLTLLAQRERAAVADVEAQTEAVAQSKLTYDALTGTFQVYDRELQIVLRSQALMAENSALTQEAARDMAAEYVDATERMRRTTQGLDEQARQANETAREIEGTFRTSVSDAFFSSAEASDIARNSLLALTKAMFEFLALEPAIRGAKSLVAGFDLGSLFTTAAGAATGASPAGPAPGYAVGTGYADPGLAWVGERGRELVAFGGGEAVLRHDEIGGLGGDKYYIDARGADAAGMSRLEQTIRSVNGSIEKRAVAAVVDERRRGNPGLR